MGRVNKGQKWRKPMLTVLTRSNPEEMQLHACKNINEGTDKLTGFASVNENCFKYDSWLCVGCSPNGHS